MSESLVTFLNSERLQNEDPTNWYWQFIGFGVGTNKRIRPNPPTCVMTTITFPYWSIVIPLTLLTTWLLLSKGRQPKAKSTDEPVSEVSE
jgi:hypothetical protein